ncbi:uncharacterized protein EDB91DRAFT_1203286 [Suillus paluster]|uniref:uncharacterized protein n=1 Tax=Suillus paluster TaxID=48578 RepID=UPI001B86FCB3|nr:uncharacterized protein EDB91DRAFT_1203286 [Suillus paluster]KAG1738656.1 hypothetical protein EDB91DRAFT_1203286 [Suillus paluster]
MPLLAGIFAKRDRQTGPRSAPPNLNVPTTATSAASIASTVVSSEPDYVFPDKSLKALPATVYAGPTVASSSKLKLPFRRKHHVHQPHATTGTTLLPVVSLNDEPPHPRISGIVSDSGHNLPPPPSKPSIFGVYHDPNVNSTHSLPNQTTRNQSRLNTPSVLARNEVHSAPPSSLATTPNLKKSGGLFSWARERTKSKPAPPPATIATTPVPSPSRDNFNLKAFRHVRSDSPAPPVDNSDADLPLPPARPRPRGDSVASNSSQRISVAAFREAQARRSRANSPVPSFRPPSALDTLRVENNSRQRASTVSIPSASVHRNSTAPPLSILINRNSSVVDTSESDESEDEDDEEVDSDGVPIKPSRKRTVRGRPGVRSRSDAGHSPAPSVQTQVPEPPRWSKLDNVQLRQPESPTAVRARASASTSALTPNAAARRASILAAANSSSTSSASEKPLSSPLGSRVAKNDDSDTSSDSDNDSEDMPLSALVAPRRPGSSASVATNRSAASRLRMPAKPLIDIKSLVGSPPVLTPVLRHEDSVKLPSRKGKEREVDKDEPFAPPPVISLTPSRMSESPAPISPRSPAGTAPRIPSPPQHNKSSSEVAPVSRVSAGSPVEVDDDLMDAIRLVTSFDKSRDASPSPARPSQQVPPLNTAPLPAVERVASSTDKVESPRDDRIVPTPVREYKPPASFSVTSRPPRRYSTDISQVPSPASPTATFSAVSKRSSSPKRSPSPAKSSFAPRSRAAILAQQSNVPSVDKSDSSSVVSTSQSSRSSRIPSVPLIAAVPESPSVKASWGSSKDLYKTRVPSTQSVVDNRMSRPTSGTLVSLAPSSRPVIPPAQSSRVQSQSLMPSRPFASNSSMRGESPAGSSTGDSSSGRGAPFTPRDGSDIGVQTGRRDVSDPDSTLKARGANGKRSTVSFEDSSPRGRERAKNDGDDEVRRNERRRNEAKAAIELGKLVNSRGPIVHNGSDDDLVLQHGQQRMSINPMMGMDGTMPVMNAPTWGSWQQQPIVTGMAPMIAPQFGPDQSFLAAHQHAMMIAKQAYQMAVAQHAMAMAGDEWERGSNIGGGSVYGGGGGSVYSGMGGSSGVGMLSVPGMGMPPMMPNQWSTGSMMFPGRISGTQSEFGGGARSVYGESFGPSLNSRSNYIPPVPNSSMSAYGGGPRPRAKTGASQPSNLQPSTPGRTPGRKAAPPSSWKSSR